MLGIALRDVARALSWPVRRGAYGLDDHLADDVSTITELVRAQPTIARRRAIRVLAALFADEAP